jgi:hypothetical protein
MKILIASLICLFASTVFAMGTMDVKTGIGYIKDSEGKIVCKYDLPKGQHPLKDGYTYTEIASKKELGNIEVYKKPIKQLTIEEKLNKLGITKEELKTLLK